MTTLVEVLCKQCSKICQKQEKHVSFALKNKNNLFCSLRCASDFRKTIITIECTTCKIKVNKRPCELKKSKSGLFYCSKSCAIKNNNTIHRSGRQNPNWKDGTRRHYRRKALSEYGHKCSNTNCPFKNVEVDVRMLDVDHIDSDRNNNDISNLQVLCVWCHGLKTRCVSGCGAEAAR